MNPRLAEIQAEKRKEVDILKKAFFEKKLDR